MKHGRCNRIEAMASLVVILIFLFGGSAFALNFSADMVSTTKGGVVKGKIFVTKEKTRMEVPQAITITRMDKKVVWVLMPEKKMYAQQALKPEDMVASAKKMPGEIERKFVGKEKINGKKTKKYRIVYKVEDRKETSYQWIATRSGLPVKSASADGSWTVEYKNIKQGKQPASLFKIPKGYKKFSFGAALMSGTKDKQKTEKKKRKKVKDEKPAKSLVPVKKLLKKLW